MSRETDILVKNKKKGHAWIWVCFLAYLFALSYVLFFAEAFGRTGKSEEYRYNLTLFQEIRRYLKMALNHNWNLFVINVVGNIAVFIPFGIFMPLLFPKCKNVILTALFSLEFSIVIEVIQIVSRVGSFDVDDLLLNTLGGVCGFIIFVIGASLWKKRSRKEEEAGDLHEKET